MVSKLVGPHATSAQQLSKESGLAQAMLSRWLKEASRVRRTTKTDDDEPARPRQMQDWKPEEKLAIVVEAAGLSEGEVGVLPRSKGIPSALLEEWRQQALTGLRGTQQIGPPSPARNASRISSASSAARTRRSQRRRR